MIDNTQISHLLQEQLNLNIKEDYLTSESYLLGTDELDSELLPTNFYNTMTSTSYLIIFFYYNDITIYVFYNSDCTKKLLTGILENERLVYYKYE